MVLVKEMTEMVVKSSRIPTKELKMEEMEGVLHTTKMKQMMTMTVFIHLK